jgi:quinolinate synthase
VVVPDLSAGCSLDEGCPVEAFRVWRAKYPGAVAVTYINCSAAVKAESDYICTSSNAEKIVRAIPADKQVLFAPDRNLGRHVMKATGRNLVLWSGSCIVHETFSERRILGLRERHKDAILIAHPECEEPILRLSAFIGSTTALIKYVVESPAKTFIVATEPGVIHQMRKLAPEKTYLEAPPDDESCACNQCPHMRKNTIENLYLCLRDLRPEVDVPLEVRERALIPIERMLALS